MYSLSCKLCADILHFIDTVIVLVMILAGSDGHDIACNIMVKGLFSD